MTTADPHTEIDLDSLSTDKHGYTVDDEDDDDPVLLDRDGDPVRNLARAIPIRRADAALRVRKVEAAAADRTAQAAEVEQALGRTARHRVRRTRRRRQRRHHQRFMEHLNPRGARVVALEKPTDLEKSQWYFQRYVVHLPTFGEMVFFDRSWYNRAGVEKVMGFCTPEQHAEFMRQAPAFEQMLVNEGIHLVKFWFSVSPAEQRTRFAIRLIDPLRQWKFSSTDMESVDRWQAYTDAKEEMFVATDTDYAPWIVVKSNDKKRGRINAMRYLLSQYDYDDKDDEVVGEPDPQIVGRALED